MLATELNGLYSNLPRRLDIDAVDWYRLTPDDVNELPPLAAFMNSLDFCNAVVRKAHPLVVRTLLEFIYKGFLVQVMGPALIQVSHRFYYYFYVFNDCHSYSNRDIVIF